MSHFFPRNIFCNMSIFALYFMKIWPGGCILFDAFETFWWNVKTSYLGKSIQVWFNRKIIFTFYPYTISQNDLLLIQPWHLKRKCFSDIICAVVRVALTNESMIRLTYSWNWIIAGSNMYFPRDLKKDLRRNNIHSQFHFRRTFWKS